MKIQSMHMEQNKQTNKQKTVKKNDEKCKFGRRHIIYMTRIGLAFIIYKEY